MYILIMFMQQHFLLIGELADFKIGNRETDWNRRTFRGRKWENEVAEHFNDWNLTCKYKKILVNNNDEHNDAFELLEKWLDNSFKKYKEVGLAFMYEKVENKLIEDTIDIESIEELLKIEKAKEDFNFFNEGDYITKEMSNSKDILLEYIEQLEIDKQKLIEKLEEDKKIFGNYEERKQMAKEQLYENDGKCFYCQEILSILKGENQVTVK